jgi:DNA-binding transcriptional ArsR family regulator
MEESRELGTRDIQSIDAVPDSSGCERPVSSDAILSAVANEHRRAILNSLDNALEQTLEYDVLVDRVADRVRDDDAKREFDGHRQRVRIALHHTHLPKLEEAGIIDYETETGHVQFVGGELERDLLTLVGP